MPWVPVDLAPGDRQQLCISAVRRRRIDRRIYAIDAIKRRCRTSRLRSIPRPTSSCLDVRHLRSSDRFGLTMYDACYLELAQRRGASARHARQRPAQDREGPRHSAARCLNISCPSAPSFRTSHATRLSRPSRLPPLLRGGRQRSLPLLRARPWRQSFELVAAGAAFPRSLHLRDLRASRLCALERAAGRP